MSKLAYLLQHEEDLSTFNEALSGIVARIGDEVMPIAERVDDLQTAIEAKIDALPAPLDFSQQIDNVASAIHRRLDAIKFPEIPKPEKFEQIDYGPLFIQQAKALDDMKALIVDLAAREYEVNIPDDRPREWVFDCKQVPSGYKITAKAQ